MFFCRAKKTIIINVPETMLTDIDSVLLSIVSIDITFRLQRPCWIGHGKIPRPLQTGKTRIGSIGAFTYVMLIKILVALSI